MRAVIQRVSEASVSIQGAVHAAIKTGFVVLLGIHEADTEADADWLSGKIARLRVFNDDSGKMNKSLSDVAGDILLISQFTLHALYERGNRPSFITAARPEKANPLYEYFRKMLEREFEKEIYTGIFGADMKVALVNDGPVTIVMDSRNR